MPRGKKAQKIPEPGPTQSQTNQQKDGEEESLIDEENLNNPNIEGVRKNDEITKLKSHIDSIEQKQKETRVRIAGVQEEREENLPKKVLKIAKSQLGMKKMKEEDIQEIYRAGKKQEFSSFYKSWHT